MSTSSPPAFLHRPKPERSQEKPRRALCPGNRSLLAFPAGLLEEGCPKPGCAGERPFLKLPLRAR